MSKAEQFIQDYTKNCSNVVAYSGMIEGGNFRYHEWLTPDQARKAVDIAREEIYDWLANHYRDYMHNPTGRELEAFFGMDMINDLKQSMKDEKI